MVVRERNLVARRAHSCLSVFPIEHGKVCCPILDEQVATDSGQHLVSDMLQRQGARSRGDYLLQPPRRREYGQTRDGGLQNQESACCGRRLSPGAAKGRLCQADRHGTKGNRSRLRHSDALNRRNLRPGLAERDA